jgi:SAM-dependent methyltransferase
MIDPESSGETARLDDRAVQYSFVASEILNKVHFGARILEVGCTYRFNFLPAVFCDIGYSVYGIDIREFEYYNDKFKFIKCDIRKTDFPDKYFDAVYAVTSLSHVGIAGRYSEIKEDKFGDYNAVNEIHRILSDDGIFLLTVPFSDVYIMSVLGRIYDMKRINDIFRMCWKNYLSKFYFYENGVFSLVNKEKANIALMGFRKNGS